MFWNNVLSWNEFFCFTVNMVQHAHLISKTSLLSICFLTDIYNNLNTTWKVFINIKVPVAESCDTTVIHNDVNKTYQLQVFKEWTNSLLQKGSLKNRGRRAFAPDEFDTPAQDAFFSGMCDVRCSFWDVLTFGGEVNWALRDWEMQIPYGPYNSPLPCLSMVLYPWFYRAVSKW